MQRLAARAIALSLLALCACVRPDPFEPAADATHVQVNDSGFTPQTVSVAVGKTVAWTNRGRVTHRVQFDGLALSTAEIVPTAWAELRFDDAGTFTYHCSVHPAETATVTVIVQ